MISSVGQAKSEFGTHLLLGSVLLISTMVIMIVMFINKIPKAEIKSPEIKKTLATRFTYTGGRALSIKSEKILTPQMSTFYMTDKTVVDDQLSSPPKLISNASINNINKQRNSKNHPLISYDEMQLSETQEISHSSQLENKIIDLLPKKRPVDADVEYSKHNYKQFVSTISTHEISLKKNLSPKKSGMNKSGLTKPTTNAIVDLPSKHPSRRTRMGVSAMYSTTKRKAKTVSNEINTAKTPYDSHQRPDWAKSAFKIN
ncbi:MAG: hypothetical protein TECD_01271 [Hyphomicrobiaceae bacterium hypho_1]